jgi:dTDP-4-dehydrorhamnose reductase
MKVAILGASGIVGQHMRLHMPSGIETVWVRKHADKAHLGLDLTDLPKLAAFLSREQPDVIVNLAGENNPDYVQNHSKETAPINQLIPHIIAQWCFGNKKYLIHTSTQAVFDGVNRPYFSDSITHPQNIYGWQKSEAEDIVHLYRECCTIARLTLILGIRPYDFGRQNPLEQMLSGQKKQVNDRWFSVLFAHDAAKQLWNFVMHRPGGVINLGIPGCTSRYEIACKLGLDVEPVSHDSFPGLASRPINTAYGSAHRYTTELDEGLAICKAEWQQLRKTA